LFICGAFNEKIDLSANLFTFFRLLFMLMNAKARTAVIIKMTLRVTAIVEVELSDFCSCREDFSFSSWLSEVAGFGTIKTVGGAGAIKVVDTVVEVGAEINVEFGEPIIYRWKSSCFLWFLSLSSQETQCKQRTE
jgi:hypothetical protein